MKYSVYLTPQAEVDIIEIYKYIKNRDSKKAAETVIDTIYSRIADLPKIPHHGHVPPELERFSIQRYRQILCNPFRIIYQIQGSVVYVSAVLDSLRTLSDILTRRLIR